MDGKSKNGEDKPPKKLDAKSRSGEDKLPEEMAGKSRSGKCKHPKETAGKSRAGKEKHPEEMHGKSENREDKYPEEMAGKSRKGKEKHSGAMHGKSGNGGNKYSEEMAGKSRKGKEKQPEIPDEVYEAAQTLYSFTDPETEWEIFRENLPATVRQLARECGRFIKKKLTKRDVKEGVCRLTLRKRPVAEHFYPWLTPKETENLKDQGTDVSVYDFNGKKYEMKFKVWGLESSPVLSSKIWDTFVTDHNLVEGQEISIQIFRHRKTRKVCFVITSESERNDLATTSAATAKVAGKKKKNVIDSRKRSDDDDGEGDDDEFDEDERRLPPMVPPAAWVGGRRRSNRIRR